MKHILEAIEKDSVEVTFYSEQYETVSEKVKLRLPCLISVRYNLNQRISD
jgi:electron transfer flavoprotein alpha/beta subunit